MKNTYGISSFTLIVTFVCLAIVGVAFIPLLPVKLVPSQELPGLSISYSMSGNSSRIVEAEVTSRLEAMLSRVKGIRGISSSSNNGSGSISLSLDKHADMEATRFEVSTIIRQVWPQLPDGVSYPQIKTKQSDKESSRPFLTYTLNAPATPILIQQYAEERLKPALAQLKGVYKVELSGATPMEWRMEYNQEELLRLGVKVSDIQQAISDYLSKEFLGTCNIEKGEGKADEWIRLVVTSPSESQKTFDTSSIYVKGSSKEKKMIPLSKLVTVKHIEEKPQSYYRINGLNSIYLSITAEETANQLQLSKEVKSTLAGLIPQMPAGYEIHISHDSTEYIHSELDKIYFRTALTIIILLLFVLLITRKVRYLLLITISLAVNIAIAVIFYYLFGLEMQLYSLAGITISLNLVIDNTIVMADHYMRQKNLKVFLSILAATLTTIGALTIIFFLEEKVRLNLQDFAAVVIINLAVSLFVSLFFVPSLMERLKVQHKRAKKRTRLRMKRFIVHFTRLYRSFICYVCRYRVFACLVLLLGFGLPVFLLPEKIEKEGKWASVYNETLGSATYKEDIKPIVDVALGGSLRLFVQKVYNGSYFSRNEETVLSVTATLPNGSTVEQMNALMKQMETYLSEFKEIKQFQTSVMGARRASMSIYFKKEHQYSGFPYILKANIISKAIELGGGSWSVYGLQDQGFNNDVRESAGSFRVKLYGYNYDELYQWAEELKKQLLTYRRIKEVIINSEFSWWKDDYQEFYMRPDKERMAQEGITASQLFSILRPLFGRDMSCGTIWTDNTSERLTLSSSQSQEYDIWGLQNMPCQVGNKIYKLSDLVTIEKEQAPQKVVKEKQQYKLCLQYEYIGSSEQGRKVLEKEIEAFNKKLPMGYTAESEISQWRWNEDDNGQYALLLLIIAILFFITSILFNSLKQPFAILFIVPVSYIGVFLTFYLFELNFDQGGFASFVLLCGITVNASIYILNEFNSIRKRKPYLSPLKAYTKAWNTKIIPIFLTIVSTVLGFIPFMVGENKEAFWFPLAVGTIGGLVMSLIGIFLYLPIFSLSRKRLPKKPRLRSKVKRLFGSCKRIRLRLPAFRK